MLDRQAILAVNDKKIVKLDIPEWKDEAYIRMWTGDERDDYLQSIVDTSGPKPKPVLKGASARAASLSLCDAEGNRLFKDSEVALLGAKSAAAIERIVKAANELNALDEDSVERLAKNSESDRSDGNGSA